MRLPYSFRSEDTLVPILLSRSDFGRLDSSIAQSVIGHRVGLRVRVRREGCFE
jgi:hypothetical protein